MSPTEIQKILDNFIEVELAPDKFLVVKETLSRIGVCPRNKPVLYQSCHILSMNGKYYITHFKELFLLDGKESSLDEMDAHRRNQIAKLLQDWNLVKIVHPERFPVEDHYMKMLKIISSKEKQEWKLVPKYHLGTRSPSRNSSSSSNYNSSKDNNEEIWTNKP